MQARRIFHAISRLPPVLIQTFVAKCSVYQRPIVEWIPRRIQRWNTQKTDAVFQDLIQISSYSMFARSQRPAQRNRPFFAILFWRDQARYGRGAGWGVRCAVAGWVLQPALMTLADCGEKAGNHVSGFSCHSLHLLPAGAVQLLAVFLALARSSVGDFRLHASGQQLKTRPGLG